MCWLTHHGERGLEVGVGEEVEQQVVELLPQLLEQEEVGDEQQGQQGDRLGLAGTCSSP